MKSLKMILAGLCLVGVSQVAHAKKDTKRKPAQIGNVNTLSTSHNSSTHGGVRLNNAQYRAVVNFALSEAEEILKIASVVQKLNCADNIYEVKYIELNNRGERVLGKPVLFIASGVPDGEVPSEEIIKVSEYTGACR